MFILVKRHVNHSANFWVIWAKSVLTCAPKNPQGFTLFWALLVATNKYPVEDSRLLGCDTVV
jgi:hypothetical protein